MSAAALLLLIRDFVVTDDDALWESLEYFFLPLVSYDADWALSM